MSDYFVTGGAGFVGSHLVEALLRAGHHVSVIDDLSSGRIQNLNRFRAHPRLDFAQGCVTNQRLVAEFVDRADVIFHLAATVGVFNIIENPVATIENNIGGTEVLLNVASKQKKKVIVASTSEVYGKTKKIPFEEGDDLVFGPTSKSRWSYACSKAIDEFLALAHWRERGVPTVVVRLFNTIGPRQVSHYGMVVPRFLQQAMADENVTVFGNGSQRRCFTYVSDVVEWLTRLATNDKAVGEIFNLGNPEEVSITELARRVIAVAGSKSKIEYIPYEQAYVAGFEDMERRVPGIDKVVRFTGYKPRVNLDEALRHTRDWLAQESRMEALAETA